MYYSLLVVFAITVVTHFDHIYSTEENRMNNKANNKSIKS